MNDIRSFFATPWGKYVLVWVGVFLVGELIALLVWLITAGYFSPREERLLQESQWLVVEVRGGEPDDTEDPAAVEFLPGESVWQIPDPHSNGSELKAGLPTRSSRPGRGTWRRYKWKVVNGVLALKERSRGTADVSYRIVQIDQSGMTLERNDGDSSAPEHIRFLAIALPEEQQIPWYWYLWHLMLHWIWIPFALAAALGVRWAQRTNATGGRLFRLVAVRTFLMAEAIVMAPILVAIPINNRRNVDFGLEAYVVIALISAGLCTVPSTITGVATGLFCLVRARRIAGRTGPRAAEKS